MPDSSPSRPLAVGAATRDRTLGAEFTGVESDSPVRAAGAAPTQTTRTETGEPRA